jgi:perosamine synthetase
MKIRLSRPYLGNKNKLSGLLKKVLSEGFLTQGKYVEQFEKRVAEYLDVKHAVAVSSGTAALHLSLVALDIKHDDEVILPAYTFPATANVVELVGARPVFVDVDLNTFNIDVNKIEAAISSKTKAIIPVHLFGNPAEMDFITRIAKKRKINIIEDSAGALGSQYKGRKCGTMGRLGCFSFHPRKVVTTGEGGMVVTNDVKLAENIRVLRNHGMQKKKGRADFILPGFNYRMNEIEAILGLVQIQELNSIIAERQALAGVYIDYFKDVQEVAFQEILQDSTSVWQAFVIRLKNGRASQVLKTLKKKNIEANIGTYALHVLKFYSYKYGFKYTDFPCASSLYSSTIALPFYNGMNEIEIRKISDVIRRIA